MAAACLDLSENGREQESLREPLIPTLKIPSQSVTTFDLPGPNKTKHYKVRESK